MTRRRAVRVVLLAAVVAALPTLCYMAVGRFGFVWDDRELVLDCPVVTGEMPARRVFARSFWVEHDLSQGEAYRPLVKLSYLASMRLSREAGGFHWHNVWVHVANALLLYGLLLALHCPLRVAAVGAALAACHPMQTETVSWVKNRAELLSVGFSLVAALAAVRAVRVRGRMVGALLAAASVACFGGALLCKSTAVGYLFVLGFGVLWLTRESGRSRGMIAGYVAMLVLYVMLRGPLVGPGRGALPSALGVASRLGFYGRLLLWPVGQSAQHAFAPSRAGALAGWLWVAAMVLGMAASRRRRWHCVGWLVCGLLLGLALVGPFPLRPVAEQRAYAAAGAALVVLTPGLVASRRRLALTLAGLVACSALTMHRAFVWRSDATLWRDAVMASGPQARTLTNLGLTYQQQGRYGPALWAFGKAAAMDAKDINPLYNAGVCQLKLAQWARAAALFERAAALEAHAPSYAGLAFAYAHLGRLDAARTAAQRAHELLPDSPLVRQVMQFIESQPRNAGPEK